jgi:hypothetical protein
MTGVIFLQGLNAYRSARMFPSARIRLPRRAPGAWSGSGDIVRATAGHGSIFSDLAPPPR